MWRWFERLGDETRAPRQVLQALADFADPEHRPPPPTQIPLDAFAWLRIGALRVFGGDRAVHGPGRNVAAAVVIAKADADRLATVDRLRPEHDSLRVGWLFVAGSRPTEDGSRQRVFHPLITIPVHVDPVRRELSPVGAAALSPLITDPADARALLQTVEPEPRATTLAEIAAAGRMTHALPRYRDFALLAAHAAGFEVRGLRHNTHAPDRLMAEPVLDVITSVGVYAVDDVRGPTWAPELRLWADRRLRTWTAMHSLYLPKYVRIRRGEPEPVHAAHRLTPAQAAAVDVARRAEVTVVTGAPGTGKSQTIAAVVADAVRRQRTVLVTARTDASVDALIELLDQAEGPPPVVFGSVGRRAVLARRLARDALPSASPDEVLAAAGCRDQALAALDGARLALTASLTDPGGRPVPDAWEHLRDLTAAARRAVGAAIEAGATAAERHPRDERELLAPFIEALRAPPELRRERIADAWRWDLRPLLPLWIGTLRDVDELLPQLPGLFDLVVFDEANLIDQTEAAPALLRAFDCVVVGDTRQLRHVSFVSHQTVEGVLALRGLDAVPHTAARLDVRSNSLLDAAAMVAPVHHLDEHFRSDPPVVEPVFDALYGGAVRMATRTPASEATSLVEVRPVTADPAERGAVTAEVDEVLAELHRLRGAGERSVAVVSPFRAQVRAIERRVLAELSYAQIEGLDLRIGTVHGMQGNERDVVILSLGVGGDAGARRWRFIDDPSLSAVMLTRARRRLIVVHGAPIPPRSLLARLTRPWTRPERRSEPVDGRAEVLAVALVALGLPVEHAYPVGRHVIDVVVGGPEAYMGVFVAMHHDGVDAHIDRHLELLELGWTLVDAPHARGDAVAIAALADEIAVRLASLRPSR